MALGKSGLSRLTKWYQNSARVLPWRETIPHPYRVWISEIMSQQSTLKTVIPYFDRWLKSFPTLETLAAAEEGHVLEHWAGLGYYSRARNVHRSAQEILAFKKSTGRWPHSVAEWQNFRGVGPYTAAAIAAIAFGEPVLPLDGNVLRVFARLMGLSDPLNLSTDRQKIARELGRVAERVVLRGQHGRVAQAFMELGALICRPGAQALCDICPLRVDCWAYRHKRVAHIPRPKVRRVTQKLRVLVPLFRNNEGALLLRQIPPGRRLAGQWELPHLEVGTEMELDWPRLRATFAVVGPLKHAITHHLYEVWAAEAGPWSGALPGGHAFWTSRAPFVSPQRLSTLTRKILLKKELL